MSKKMNSDAVLIKDFKNYLLRATRGMLVDAPVAIKSLELALQKRNLTDLEAEFISNLRVYPVDSGEQVKKSKIDVSCTENKLTGDLQWVTRDYDIVCKHLCMCIELLDQLAEWDCDKEVDGSFENPTVAYKVRSLLAVVSP